MTTSVSAFLYRLPRFDIFFPIEFVADGEAGAASPLGGRCLNLSKTGLLGSFVYPIGEGSTGVLRLQPAARTFPIRVTATHCEGMRCGLRFEFANDQERQVVRALVDAIASHSGQPI